MVSSKWDRARTANSVGKQTITSVTAAGFDNFTAAELAGFRAAASRTLAYDAATLPRPSDRWSRGFWQGFAASWAYALSIALVAFIIEWLGSDLITVLRHLFGGIR